MRFKCKWGHGARRNGNYFRSRIWLSDVFSFSAGIARRTAIQPKIFFSQPNGEDQSPRSETSATSGILLRNQICVRHCRSLRQFGCSSLWVAKALHRRENQKKKIFCVACGATNFFFNRSPRGWGGLGRSVYLPFLERVSVLK